jgi:hypothetical protein
MSVDSPADSNTERELFEESVPVTVFAQATLSKMCVWHIVATVDADEWVSSECSIRTDEPYLFKTSTPVPYVAAQLVEIETVDDCIRFHFEKGGGDE